MKYYQILCGQLHNENALLKTKNNELNRSCVNLQTICDNLVKNEIHHIDKIMILENKIASLKKKLLNYTFVNTYPEKQVIESVYFISDCSYHNLTNNNHDDISIVSSITENE